MKTKILGVGVIVMAMTCVSLAQAQIIMMNTAGGGINYWNNGRVFMEYRPMPGGGLIWQYRGVDGKSVLFESEEFSSRVSDDVWLGAVENRDVPAMVKAAWGLKGVETILGKKDKKTTSDAMFKAAAEVAVEQRRSDILSEIVALCPACKSYQEEMKAAGQTRGIGSPIAMPQIFFPDWQTGNLPSVDTVRGKVKEMLKGLQPWQTPYLTPDMVRFNFRGMSSPEAENIAILANRGRQTGKPSMLAEAALELALVKGESDISFLAPSKILGEAAQLALVLNDQEALGKIIGIYQSNQHGLKSEDQAKALLDEAKTMGATRGMLPIEDDLWTTIELLTPRYVCTLGPTGIEARDAGKK